MPSNVTPSTATVITSLPYAENTDPTTSTTPSVLVPTCGSEDFPLWWVYTPPAGVNAIGVLIESAGNTSEYQPGLSIWTGTLPVSLTQLDNCCYSFKNPTKARIGVTPGTAYYLLVSLSGGSGVFTSADLTITVSTLAGTAPAGSLLITSDVGNQATIVISGADGTSVRALGMGASEMGDFLDTSELAIMAEPPDDATIAEGVQIWDTDLSTLTTTVTSIVRVGQSSISPIRSDRNGTWYVASVLNAAGAAVINTLNAAGSVGGTSWTLPANSSLMTCMGVTQDGSTLYYGNSTNNTPIYAYDLDGSAALPDFLAAPGANLRWQRDMWVLANGDVLIVQRSTVAGTAFNVKHYNSSAVLQHTYPISGVSSSNPRMGLSADETTFVVMSFRPSNVSRFETFTIGNTTAIDSFDVDQNDNIGNGPLYGPSLSCPLLMLPGAASFGDFEIGRAIYVDPISRIVTVPAKRRAIYVPPLSRTVES